MTTVDYHPPGYWAEYAARPDVKARQRARYEAGAASRRAARRRAQAQRALDRAAQGVVELQVWVAGPCSRCGVEFVGRRPQSGQPYCSRRCKKLEHKARRKARMHGVDIVPGQRWRVFRLADWRCHICGLEIPKDVEVPDLAAPVVDHIIPLAKGGAHAPDNWGAAHFYCNSVKAEHDVDATF